MCPPCDVPSGVREAGNDAVPNRIGSKPNDDRYRRRGELIPARRRRGRGDDQIDFQADELSREPGELIGLPLREPNVNDDTSPLYPTEVAEPLPESAHIGPAGGRRSLV